MMANLSCCIPAVCVSVHGNFWKRFFYFLFFPVSLKCCLKLESNFSFFSIESPGNPFFFSKFLVSPPGIAMTFTLPPGIFHLWCGNRNGNVSFLLLHVSHPDETQRPVRRWFIWLNTWHRNCLLKL